MHLEKRLPRNGKEFALFLFIVSIISVNIIAPLIMGFEFGFCSKTYFQTLKVIPVMWLIVISLVTIVAKPIVAKLMSLFITPQDSFNARVLFNILFSVTVLSILLTIIGTWVGQKKISIQPFHTFFYSWPRNFFIAFWVETLIAQPIARLAMKKLHEFPKDKD